MIFKLLLVLASCGSSVTSAHDLTLQDFRFGAPPLPADHLSQFAQCEKQLGAQASPRQRTEIADTIRAALDYVERWATAESGVEFAKITLPEALALDARMVGLLERLRIPGDQFEQFDTAYQQLIWVHMYLGYAASPLEIKKLQDEIREEIDTYLGDEPPDELRERWLHEIMLVSQQIYLANKRGAGLEYSTELIVMAQQLRGISPGDLIGEEEPDDSPTPAPRRTLH